MLYQLFIYQLHIIDCIFIILLFIIDIILLLLTIYATKVDQWLVRC